MTAYRLDHVHYSPRSTFWFYSIIATRFSILSSILYGGTNILVESFWLNTSMIRLLVYHYSLVVWWHVATSLSLVPLKSFGQDVLHQQVITFVGILDLQSSLCILIVILLTCSVIDVYTRSRRINHWLFTFTVMAHAFDIRHSENFSGYRPLWCTQ